MDGVLCDYITPYNENLLKNNKQLFPQSEYGFFIKLKPIDNAIESVIKLTEKYDIWILTKPSTKNLNSYSEKAYWILQHLGQEMLNKTIFSCNKALLMGDILIDDQNNANQDKFIGKWIQFGSNKYKDWNAVLIELLK